MTSGVWPALCGESTTFGSARIGSPGLIGSSWKTSSPAAASLFCGERVEERVALDQRARGRC